MHDEVELLRCKIGASFITSTVWKKVMYDLCRKMRFKWLEAPISYGTPRHASHLCSAFSIKDRDRPKPARGRTVCCVPSIRYQSDNPEVNR